jgi:hypothetical protein
MACPNRVGFDLGREAAGYYVLKSTGPTHSLEQPEEFFQSRLVIVPDAFAHLNPFWVKPIEERLACRRTPVGKGCGGRNFHGGSFPASLKDYNGKI